MYAKLGKQDDQDEIVASCVIDAPEMSSDLQSLDARVKISGASGPRGNLQAGDEYVMQFIQPPTIMHSDVQYDEHDTPGYYIRVVLRDVSGMRQVCDAA